MQDQYINQAPNATSKEGTVLTLRLEAVRLALEMDGWHEDDWPWLRKWAFQIFRLVHGIEQVNWPQEMGKPVGFAHIKGWELASGYKD